MLNVLRRSTSLPAVSLVFVLLGSSPSTVSGQVDSAGTALVGALLSQAEEALEGLVTEGFDRFDQSLLNTATQARALLNQFSRSLLEVTHLGFDELDAQQRRAYSDIEVLTESVSEALTSDVGAVVEPIQHNMQLLAGRTGYILVSGGQAVRGDEHLEFSLRGSALSRARIRDFRLAGLPTEVGERSRDDQQVVLRVSLREGPAADAVQKTQEESEAVELPITFSVRDCWFFDLFCFNERRFSITGRVLPTTVGTARAVFVGEVNVLSRAKRKLGPYSGGRVRSSFRTVLGVPTGIRRGMRTDHFTAQPTKVDWRIDVETVRIEVIAFRECDGHSATWTEISEQSVTVKVISKTEAEPWVNCKVDVWIGFDEFLVDRATRTVETPVVPLTAGNRTLLELPESVELDRPRLAHVEIESRLLSSGRVLVRRGERRSGVIVEEEPVGGRGAYVEVGWVGRR